MVLVLNSGSSSIKLSLFEKETLVKHLVLEEISDHEKELHKLLFKLDTANIKYIAHRVVHGGNEFVKPTRITQENIQKLKQLSHLAPLHNPANIKGIEYFLKHYPELPQIAVFDTAFHSTLPQEAYLYAIPQKFEQEHHIRRYGFHGSSHAYLLKESAKLLQKEIKNTSLITLHLGNGASVCAIQNGKSIDTSMGMTPLEGLVMGSRSGDIDAGVVLYLQQQLDLHVKEVDTLLNKQSGLKGLCGTNDLREIINHKNKNTKLTLDIYIRRIIKYIGAYMTLVENLDAIIFSGGVGENSAYIREKVLQSLEKFGILTDFEKNNTNETIISQQNSLIKIFVIKTNEELEILRSAKEVLHD